MPVEEGTQRGEVDQERDERLDLGSCAPVAGSGASCPSGRPLGDG
jgi:hypothetical protein